MKPTKNQQVMKHTQNQQVTSPQENTMLLSVTGANNQTIKLTTVRRIKHDAIRILRTIKPELGRVYADTRKKGIRYKIAYGAGKTLQEKRELVIQLNNLYGRAGLFPAAVAYIHQEQNMFKNSRVCVFIKK